ncbi:hypothetical protein ABT340_15535 [Streptosporangium sp. NPDC000239]|uniref:hypothetical protein n=1 Tax=Streptosporangium sp. NPDC000239 TaxID=3154248 RepID=UPI00331B3F48
MTSEELANEVMSAVMAVQSRIVGVGQEQYSLGSQQKFELMSLAEIIQYAREEIEDGIAYHVMLRYKLGLLDKAVAQAFAGYNANRSQVEVRVPTPPLPDAMVFNQTVNDFFGGQR